MKTAMKATLNVLGVAAIFFTFCCVVYVDKKVDDLDDAVFQYMKEEHNEKWRLRHAGDEDKDLCDN